MTAEAWSFVAPELDSLERAALGIALQVSVGIDVDRVVEVPTERFASLADRAARHRVIGAFALAATRGRLSLSTQNQSQLTEAWRSRVRSDLRMQTLLLDVTAVAADVGVEFVVLKGVATARLDFAQPSVRHSNDLDLLLRLDDLSRLRTALIESGYSSLPSHISGPEYGKGETVVSPSGGEVDLHHRLSLLSSRRGIPEAHDHFDIGGTTHRALASHWRLVHGGLHLFHTPPGHRKLSSALDAAALVRSGTSATEAIEAADTLGLRASVATGICWACDVCGVDAPDELRTATSQPQNRTDVLALRAFSRRSRSKLREERAHMSLMSPLDRIHYARAFLFPDSDYREHWGRHTLAAQTRYLKSRLTTGTGGVVAKRPV